MLSKRLVCLSLVVTTLFISNRSHAMATTAVVGAAAAAIAAPAAVPAAAAGTIILHIVLWGGSVTLTIAASPAAIAVGTTAGVIAGGVGIYHYCKRSKATSALEAKFNEKFCEQEKRINISEARHTAEMGEVTAKLSASDKMLASVTQKLAKAEEREALGVIYFIPAGIRHKIEGIYTSLSSNIKKGGQSAWKFTCKDHPYITVIVIASTTGYIIYKKYGKDIKEVFIRLFKCEDQKYIGSDNVQVAKYI